MAQQSERVVQTFLFTALTQAHGDEQAADLVAGFCAAVRRLLAAHQAHEVKPIGDGRPGQPVTGDGAVECAAEDEGGGPGLAAAGSARRLPPQRPRKGRP